MKKIISILLVLTSSIFMGVLTADLVGEPALAYGFVPGLALLSFIPMPSGVCLMTYAFSNVPKPSGSAPGVSNKHHILYLFRMDDVTIPTRDAKGVKILTDITPSNSFIKLYITPGTQKWSMAAEGDADSRAVIQTLEGDFPNYEEYIAEFIQNNLNENLGAVLTFCDSDKKLLFGSKCAPLQLEPECTDDVEKAVSHLVFKSSNKGPVVAIYEGSIDLGSGSGSVA